MKSIILEEYEEMLIESKYEIIAYHSTDSDISEFNFDDIDIKSGSSTSIEGLFFSNVPQNSWGDNIYKVKILSNNPAIFDMNTSRFDSVSVQEAFRGLLVGETRYMIDDLVDYAGMDEEDAIELVDRWENLDLIILKNANYAKHTIEYIVPDPFLNGNSAKIINLGKVENDINEGFSNYKGILDDVKYSVSEKLKSLDGKKAKFNRKELFFEREIVYNEFGQTKYETLFIKLDHNVPLNKSYFDPPLEFLIGIKELVNEDGIFEITSEKLNRVLSAVAHEITHYSQKRSKFSSWDERERGLDYLRKFANGETNLKSYAKYYDKVGHSERKTEQEARLVEILSLIKNKEFELALNKILKSYRYLKDFSWKKVLIVMFDYGIDYRREYKQFQEYCKDFFGEESIDNDVLKTWKLN